MLGRTCASLLAVASAVSAASWTLTDSYTGDDFMDASKWNYTTGTDPTHGLVTYQSASSAKSLNLTRVNGDVFYMGVSTVATQLSGRPSVRINSQKNYSDGVYVLDAAHMPVGCSVWPAWWTVTSKLASWPTGGEIDIVENANDQYNSNLASLHTASSCIVPKKNNGTGTIAYYDCGDSSTGCRIETNGTSGANAANTGSAFNKAGGGIFAMERALGSTGNGIRVWFFSHDNAPSDLQSGSSVNPDNWGSPQAQFDIADECHSQFGEHQITFDITLCGDWAANTYSQTSCATEFGACSSQVAYNGSSYSDAYWAVNSVKVFSSGGSTDNAANSANTASLAASAVAASNSGTSSSKSASASLVSADAVAAWRSWGVALTLGLIGACALLA